jgi:YgiT-type zinc finger domain-containing protein
MEIKNDAHTCPNCGTMMERRVYKHVEHVGGLKVIDQTGMACVCPKCGEVHMPLDMLHGYELRAARTALHDGKERVTGSALRYARKAVGLTQKQLGALLGYDHATISRIEGADEPVQNVLRLSMLSIVDAALAGATPEDMLRSAGEPARSSLEVKPQERARKVG